MPDTGKTGEIYAVNVPGLENWTALSQDQAVDLVRRYRWIYVNASLKGNYASKDEATKLSNALNRRPMVHVYLSKTLFDGTRNTYPGRFHAAMSALIEATTENGEEVLVTGRSYGVHQALRAACRFNKPTIAVIGIAPAFGAFGNQWSDNVRRYVLDVATTRCRYGMIASKRDFFTWKSGGAARKRRVLYRGDNDVGRAADRNPHNVHIEVIKNAHHAPIDEYIRYGLVPAMQRTVRHFGMHSLTDIVDGVRV